MGAWGIQPEETDRADDWLINLWRDCDLFARVEKTIGGDPRSDHEELRIAIALAVSLDRFGLIPTTAANRFWLCALEKLRSIRAHDVYQVDDFQQALTEEIRIIEAKCGNDTEIGLPDRIE